MENQGEEKSFGPLIAIIVIVVILIAGGFYVWKKNPFPTGETGLNEYQDDAVAAALVSLNSDDDIDSIEADIYATDFGIIDSGLEPLE